MAFPGKFQSGQCAGYPNGGVTATDLDAVPVGNFGRKPTLGVS